MHTTTTRGPFRAETRSLPEYRPTPYTDFSRSENRVAFERALNEARSRLGREYPNLVGGRKTRSHSTFDSINPARPGEVIGHFPAATPEQAALAVEAAQFAFPGWRSVPADERASYLLEASRRMRENRHAFSAVLVLEVGKTWAEADADTAEAIDFLEFYAREMLRYAAPQPVTQLPGEHDSLIYEPLGVGVVMPPWNFPLAITVGMTSAALVTGNTVVLKPSSDAPAIAWAFVQLMEEVGLPNGVLNFVTGSGATIGEALVRHPKTRFVAFTGSKDVGIGISRIAAEIGPGQVWIKRVVAELGGKDAIIIDDEADLDAAVQGVVVSAFGFQGQKCSACSRAIVSRKLYEPFLDRLKAEVARIRVGEPDRYGVTLGPVINARARETILRYIETGKREGRLIAGGRVVEGSSGFFLEPTVFADVKPGAVIEQEEIFGPVLAVIPVRDFDEALAVANDTPYGLTGSVYTRSAEKIERAKREFHVGNLYINRKCTGAIVGAHPFGGFNLSGTDSKAGGRDYLLLFLQAKSIGEKVA